MKRFVNEKKRTNLKPVISMALFLAFFLLFLLLLSGVSDKNSEKQTEMLRLSISRGIAHCYSMEGHYPEDLEYLKEHYGITYNEDEYFVGYQVLGENIFPDVTIIKRNQEGNINEEIITAYH